LRRSKSPLAPLSFCLRVWKRASRRDGRGDRASCPFGAGACPSRAGRSLQSFCARWYGGLSDYGRCVFGSGPSRSRLARFSHHVLSRPIITARMGGLPTRSGTSPWTGDGAEALLESTGRRRGPTAHNAASTVRTEIDPLWRTPPVATGSKCPSAPRWRRHRTRRGLSPSRFPEGCRQSRWTC